MQKIRNQALTQGHNPGPSYVVYTMGDPGVFFTDPHLYPCLQVQVLTGMATGAVRAHGATGSHGMIGLRCRRSLPGGEEEEK
jgi:hypothetical protein